MSAFDPYDDPWMDDDQTIMDAFHVMLQSFNTEDDRLKEVYEWALGTIVNRRDRIFVCAVEQCSCEKLSNLFEEVCREKYMFGAMHLAEKTPYSLSIVGWAAQTGSLELLEKVLGDAEITKEVSNTIITGALKGDCLNIVQHFCPNGLGEHHRGFVRFAARFDAIACLRHYVTEPLSSQDWEHCIEYAFKDHGAQTIAFLWDNPPLETTISVEEYAINIAERLIGDRLPWREGKAFACLRLCMHRVAWENLEADIGHRSGFKKHMGTLIDLHQEQYREQLRQHLDDQVGTGFKKTVRKI